MPVKTVEKSAGEKRQELISKMQEAVVALNIVLLENLEKTVSTQLPVF